MNRKHFAAVSIMFIFGLTSLAFAQGQFYAESTNSWQVESVDPAPPAALAGGALATRAPFYAESTNSWEPVDSGSSTFATAHERYGKPGSLRLEAAVKLAGATLNPGDYDVRYVESPEGHYVEFNKTVENDLATEGLSVYEQEVVAEVPCTMEQLNAVVAHTELLANRSHNVARLEIRGEKVVHLF